MLDRLNAKLTSQISPFILACISVRFAVFFTFVCSKFQPGGEQNAAGSQQQPGDPFGGFGFGFPSPSFPKEESEDDFYGYDDDLLDSDKPDAPPAAKTDGDAGAFASEFLSQDQLLEYFNETMKILSDAGAKIPPAPSPSVSASC